MWNARYGGAETMLVDIINHQVAEHEVALVVINNLIDNDLLEGLDPAVRVVLLGRKPRSRALLPLLRLNLQVLAAKADVIHFHQEDIIRYIPVRLFRRNLCITVHNTEMNVSDIAKFDCVFTISQAVKTKLKVMADIDSILIVNGIMIDQFVKKTNWESNDDEFNIIQISRLEKQKGHFVMLEAMKMLLDDYSFYSARLFLFGEGALEHDIRKDIFRLALQDHVSLMGIRPKEYIRKHLHEYDLLVQPSLWEGFGLTAVEGMAAKVPLLLADVDGLASIAKGGEMAHVFEPGNAKELAGQIYRIARLPALDKKNKADKAWGYALAEYDVSRTAKDYIKGYESLLHGSEGF